jgi:hypothetical protein
MSLDTLGGPDSLVIKTDFGAIGQRGTNFYLSYGNPNIPGTIDSSFFANEPIIYDLCINIKPDDANYLDVYQYLYVPQLGTNMWVVGLQLAPALVVKKKNYTFVPGSLIGLPASMGYATLDDVVISVAPELALALSLMTSEQRSQAFIAQANILHEIYNLNPISSVITSGQISVNTVSNEITVPLSLGAMEYNSGWVPLTGEKTVSLVLGITAS